MKFHEKLEKLTRLINKKKLSTAAGLGPATVANILIRKAGVECKTGAALARVLGVDAGWLMDDSKQWPPVRVEEVEEVGAEACHAA